MLSMTVAGVAYAHWTDYIEITGRFCMGTMDIAESVCVWFLDVNDKTMYDYGDHVAKAYINPIPSDDQIVRSIEVTIDNAYPNLAGYIVLDYHNVGTVPAMLKDLKVNGLDTWQISDWPDQGEPDYLHIWVEGWYPPDDDFAWPGQLDPCHWAYIVIGFRLTNDVDEMSTYTFTVDTVWYNWNEPMTNPDLTIHPLGVLPDDIGPYYLYDCFVPDDDGYIPGGWMPRYIPPS